MSRRAAAFASMSCAVMMGAGSFAWACSLPTGPYLDNLEPNRGPSGTNVVLRGGGWQPGGIEIRFDSSGGRLLGTGNPQGGAFSTVVKIEAPPRNVPYYLYAVQGGTTRATPFEVTGATASTGPQAGGNPSESTGGSTSGATSADQSRSGSTSASAEGGSNPSTVDDPASGSSRSGSDQEATNGFPGSAPAQANPSGVSGLDAQVATRSGPTPGRANVASADKTSSRSGPATATGAPAGVPPAVEDAMAPSSRTAAGDVYAGFAPGGGPGLTDHRAFPLEPSSSPNGPVLVALFSAGLVALFGGFAVAEARRRRVMARSVTGD